MRTENTEVDTTKVHISDFSNRWNQKALDFAAKTLWIPDPKPGHEQKDKSADKEAASVSQ